MRTPTIDRSAVPDPAGFATGALAALLEATGQALGTSRRALSLFCGLSEHAIEQLGRKPDTVPRADTRVRIATALGVPLAEINRLCGLPEDAESAAAEVLARRGDVPCPWCPADTGHRAPAWAPEAVERYQHGAAAAAIAAALGLTVPTINGWIEHASVRRSRASAAALRSQRARGKVFDAPVNPQLCECGCGQPTSGVPFRDKAGTWRYPRFVKGHRKGVPSGFIKREKGVPPIPHDTGSPRLVREVLRRLHELDRNLEWLEGETGISREALYGTPPKRRPKRAEGTPPERPRRRPETAARLAIALDLDVAESVRLAGWPDPLASPIAMKFLERLAVGKGEPGSRRAGLAALLGISRDTIDDALTEKNHWFTPATIRRLALILELTASETEQELDRAREGHQKGRARRQQFAAVRAGGPKAAATKRAGTADERARALCEKYRRETGKLPSQTWLEEEGGVYRVVAKRVLATFRA